MHVDNSLVYKTTSPLTFLAWLENQQIISPDYNINFKNYQFYIAEWHKFNKSTEEAVQESFASLYIDLIRDISLTYSTEEEKRFISNCNFEEPEELDIVLPFFIQKLKTIILYNYKQREKLKKKIKDLPTKGTTHSVDTTVKDIILDEIESEELQVFLGTRFVLPPIEQINKNLNVRVEELYDDEVYSNKATNIKELDIDPDLFLNFKKAVVTAINKYPIFLKGLQQTFSVNLNLSGSELNLLKQRDFLDYFVSDKTDDLKIQLYRNFYIKFMGCDMYYLSTGSTINEIVSGRLFETAPLSGNIVLNPQNKQYPSVSYIPSLSSIFTAYECGRFFIPSKLAAIEYSTFNKRPKVDTSKLQPNKFYMYPDPSMVGNVGDGTGTEQEFYPLVYEIEVSANKKPRQDAFLFSDVMSSPLNELFYPYNSVSQDVFENKQGISTPYDDLTFWGGEKETFWTNSDIWPDLSVVETLPIDKRLQNLVIDQGYMVKWFTDIYGNEYGLFKKNTNTLIERKTSPGTIYIKTLDGVVEKFTEAFKDVLVKLPLEIVQEIENAINLYVINQTLLIETENYVIIDVITYNPNKKIYISSLYPGFYRKKYSINKYLEKFIGYTYRDDNNSLYLCFTTLNPQFSSTNYKSIQPLIFKVDIDLLKIYTVYPGKNSTVIYSLSSAGRESPEIDLRYLDSGHFSHKASQNLYNLSYIVYNLNSVPFIVNEKFYSNPYIETFQSSTPLLYKPFMYVYDTNFSLQIDKTRTSFISPYTDYAGSYNIEKFKIHRDNKNAFSTSTFNTFVINTTGTDVINFDWSKFSSYNLYIGCSAFSFVNLGNVLLFPSTTVLMPQENVSYKLMEFRDEERIFEVVGKIIPETRLNAMEITVRDTFTFNETLTSPFTGVFCETPFTSYSITDVKGFDNVVAVGKIDPVFINQTGTTFLHLDWTSYNNANIYIGCSAFNIFFAEDVLVFNPSGVLMLDDEVWYDLVSFTQDNRQFFVKGKILNNSGKEIIELYIGEILSINDDGTIVPPFSGVFCEAIYSIFKLIQIQKVGDGEGTVSSNPACIDCGTKCDFLYPVGSTISFRASAAKDSTFAGWAGGDCTGAVGDCFLNVTDNITISATFIKTPSFDVSIFVNLTGTVVNSFDGVVYCPGQGTCTYSFLRGTPLSLSASPGPDGYIFKGFRGGPCDSSFICSFFVNGSVALTAFYEPKTAYLQVENSFVLTPDNQNFGFYVVGREENSEIPIKITGRNETYQDTIARGVDICGAVSLDSPGTIYLSLCPSIAIKNFHDFEFPTGVFASVSSTVAEPYAFGGYLGKVCEGELNNYCAFGIRGVEALTGLFTPPFYTVNVLNYSEKNTDYTLGNVLTFNSTNSIRCQTYDVNSSCVGVFASGTKVDMFVLPSEGSFVHGFLTSDGLSLTGLNFSSGLTGLSASFYVNNFVTVSVISEAIEYKSLRIVKQFIPETSDLLTSITVTPGPSGTQNFVLPNNERSAILLYPKGVEVNILPNNSTLGKTLYTVGASGLRYSYEIFDRSGLTLDPNPSEFTQDETQLGIGFGVNMVGSTGPLLGFTPPLNVEFRDSELTLTNSETVTCVFIPYNTIPAITV